MKTTTEELLNAANKPVDLQSLDERIAKLEFMVDRLDKVVMPQVIKVCENQQLSIDQIIEIINKSLSAQRK